MEEVRVRLAEKKDVSEILELLRHLAKYEDELEQFTITENFLLKAIFGDSPYAQYYVLEENGHIVGTVGTFLTLSTYKGRFVLNFQDLIVKEECRGKGYGKKLIDVVFQAALEKDCCRVDWGVLGWNKPAIKFYKEVGAAMIEGNPSFSISEEQIKKFGM